MLFVSSILIIFFLLGAIVSLFSILITSYIIPKDVLVVRIIFSGFFLSIISSISIFIINYLNPFLFNQIQVIFSQENFKTNIDNQSNIDLSPKNKNNSNINEDDFASENITSERNIAENKNTYNNKTAQSQHLIVDYPDNFKGVKKENSKLIVDGYHFEDDPKLMARTISDVLEKDTDNLNN